MADSASEHEVLGIEGDVPGELDLALCAASSARVHLDVL